MRRIAFVAMLVASMSAFCVLANAARAEEAKPTIDHSKLQKAGTVTVTEYEAGIGVVDTVWGHGEVQALGQKKKFRLQGMGAGEGGGTKISATGTVYNLKNIDLFAGAYKEASAGVVGGDKSASTAIWLRNTNGVVMELHGKASGLAVTGGANGIVVEFEK
jgi:hypothetical protein